MKENRDTTSPRKLVCPRFWTEVSHPLLVRNSLQKNTTKIPEKIPLCPPLFLVYFLRCKVVDCIVPQRLSVRCVECFRVRNMQNTLRAFWPHLAGEIWMPKKFALPSAKRRKALKGSLQYWRFLGRYHEFQKFGLQRLKTKRALEMVSFRDFVIYGIIAWDDFQQYVSFTIPLSCGCDVAPRCQLWTRELASVCGAHRRSRSRVSCAFFLQQRLESFYCRSRRSPKRSPRR